MQDSANVVPRISLLGNSVSRLISPGTGVGTIAQNTDPETFPWRYPELAGYIKAEHKEDLANRLDRIEGQARGIKRMVDREAYCVDILTQVHSLIGASERVAAIVLEDHIDYCVKEALESGERADEKMAELKAAVDQFLKMARRG